MLIGRRREVSVLIALAAAGLVVACTVPTYPNPSTTTTSSTTTTTSEPPTTTTTSPPAPPPDPRLGGARNFLGTGDLTMRTGAPYSALENAWLAISGRCASKEQGDRIMTVTDANFTDAGPNGGGSWSSCTGGATVPNPEFRPDGYFYGITFEHAAGGPAAVQVFDAGERCAPDGAGDTPGPSPGASFVTQYLLRGPDGPGDPATATLLASVSASPGTRCGVWTTVGTIDAPSAGTYILQVRAATDASGTSSNGSNGFAIRVTAGTTSWNMSSSACSNDPADPFFPLPAAGAVCPQVHALGHLGMKANAPTGSPVATFPAVETVPAHSGGTLQLELWDPGEGSRALQLLDPLGNPVPFQWEVPCYNPAEETCSDPAPTGGRGPAPSTVVDVSGVGTMQHAIELTGQGSWCPSQNPQPGPNRTACFKYNDRLLRLTVQLPDDIAAAYGGATWWKVRYASEHGTSPTDRTTWSASVVPAG